MLIDSGKVIYTSCKEPPVIISRVELKKDAVREEFKNFITQGEEQPRKIEQKKRARAANP